MDGDPLLVFYYYFTGKLTLTKLNPTKMRLFVSANGGCSSAAADFCGHSYVPLLSSGQEFPLPFTLLAPSQTRGKKVHQSHSTNRHAVE